MNHPVNVPVGKEALMTTTHHSGRGERQVTLNDGTVLEVRDSGPRTAKNTVVFLHGLCRDKSEWAHQIGYLARRYGDSVRLISYDHRGHGQSAPAPMGTYRIEQLAEDLAQLLTVLEVGGAVTLVGHSMGGMAALAYLGRAQRPVQVRGLVLAATAAGKIGERGLGRLLGSPAAAALYGLIEHTPAIAIRALVGPVCASLRPWQNRAESATFAALAVAALTTTPVQTAVGFLPSLRTHDQYAALSSITARTVVLSGGLDPLTPPVHARELADAIPEARHVHVPGAGHMLPQEAPHVLNAAIGQAMAIEALESNSAGEGRRARRRAVVAS